MRKTSVFLAGSHHLEKEATTILSRRGANPHSCRFQCVFLVRWEHHIAYSDEELRFRQPGKCPAVLLGFGENCLPLPVEGCEGFPRPQRRPFSLGTGVNLWSLRGHCGRRVALGAPSQARVLLLLFVEGRNLSKQSLQETTLGSPSPFYPLSRFYRSFCPVRHVVLVTLRADNELIDRRHIGIAPCEYTHRTVPKGPPSHFDEVVARLLKRRRAGPVHLCRVDLQQSLPHVD